MKKYFWLMAGIILLIASACQNDELVNGGGDTTTVSFTAQLPYGDTPSTRTAGDGTQINRCILEVYRGEKLYLRQIQAVSEGSAAFDIRLVTSQTYNFVFWADHVTAAGSSEDLHYNTSGASGLQAISLKGDYTGGKEDTRDAFFATKEMTVTKPLTETIQLYRSFGQLNIKTNDIGDIKLAELKPGKAGLAFKNVYTGFNALTGEQVGEQSTLVYKNPIEVIDQNGNLTVDYIFAPASGSLLVDMTLTVNKADGTEITSRDLTSIPIQRNYKTNVSGNLLTADGEVNVNVVPGFSTPDINKEVTFVQTVAEAIDALKAGNTNIQVAIAPADAATIPLPKYNETNVAVAISLPETTQQITIEYATEGSSGSNAPAQLNISIPSAEKVVINAPQTTVTLNGKSYKEVDATTADNTLIIESSVEVGTLNLKKGNVKLYGKVATVTKDNGWQGTIIRYLDNQQSFDNLVADEASGYTDILIEREAAFDGTNATLGKPVKIAANARITNLTLHVDKDGVAVSPVEILDGAKEVVFEHLTVSSTNEASLVKVLGTNQKVTIRNSSLLLTSGKANQSGFNIQNGGRDNVITALVENTYIGFGTTKLNVSKDEDYTYTEEKKAAFTGSAYSRAITVGRNANKDYDGTATTNLTVNNCVLEGVYYVINTLHNVSLNLNVDNSILDGRAAFNIWSTAERGSTFNIKNSKLIGRNCFSGPTEEFATIVLNGYNNSDVAVVKYVRNNVITLDNCDVVSDNAPQTETNYQYGVSLRSAYYNKLILKNNTKFRETQTPRLPHAVDFNTIAWRNEVVTDGSVNLDGCAAGATVLPSNKWSGTSYANAATPADDGKIYIGDPSVFANFIASGIDGKGVEVVLARDLDMGNHNLSMNASNPSMSNFIFNGNNHTIANYTLSNVQYAGLIPNAISVTVKNLTLKNAHITAEDDGKSNAYAGGFIGRGYGTNVVENCTLENSIVQGINKVGGIVGFQAENGIAIRNCTVKGSTVKVDTDNKEYGQCGGIVGYIGAVAAANVVSGNYLIDTKVEAPENTNEGEGHRKSSICVGVLQGEANQSLTIDMPFSNIQRSTFNGNAIGISNRELLGGIRFTQNNPTVVINGEGNIEF